MQNQNVQSWAWGEGSSLSFPSTLPTMFAPAGIDQNSLLSSFQQMYGTAPIQPPADYSQWTSAQFHQWQQWQEKYQQWQAQYGKKYAESLAAMGQNPGVMMPGFPPVVLPVRPPNPAENTNPPLPTNVQPVPPPPPPDEEKPPLPAGKENDGNKESKDSVEELSEAEKTFDVQFKQWESQFEEWKKQNQDHPDKVQYREYEKKWETWREQLLQRREQMRRKRLEKVAEQAKEAAAVKTDDSKGKTPPSAQAPAQQAPVQENAPPSTYPKYGYRTQSPPPFQGPFTTEPPKFDVKPPPYDKLPPMNQPPPNNFRNPNPQELAFLNNQNFRQPPPNFNAQEPPIGAEGNFRFRNPGQFSGPRNFDNFPKRFDERRFPGDGFRNELNERKGFGERGPSQPPRPKVPSLFDIHVEKPLVMGPNEWKGKVWEKREEDFEKNEPKWGNSNVWGKNSSSPWMQPWEMEKLASQKPPEVKPWERDNPENSPWLKEQVKRDLDRAELTGYVGNILAKLGSVIPQKSDAQDRSSDVNVNEKKDEGEKIAPTTEDAQRTEYKMPPRGLEEKNLDTDERIPDKFRRDGRWEKPFSREDMRNFLRPPREDRYFMRDRDDRGDRGGFGERFPRDNVDDRFGGRNGRRGFDRFDRDDRGFDRFGRYEDLVWKPQVFDYSQGRPLRIDPDEGFKISKVVDYSHGENKQTFDYGHGEGNKDKHDLKSFDYGHKVEAPTVIDYGHGVGGSKSMFHGQSHGNGVPRIGDDSIKGITNSPVRRSRSPRHFRSRSRSPHSRFKRNSMSPPFRNLASRSRDRGGRHNFRTDRNNADKLSPSEGEGSKHSFSVTTVLVEDLICRPGRDSRPNKLVFIMRGLPGSGKTYVTKLIKDKEVDLGGDPPRILSLDDYFMTEVEKETTDPETGRKVKTKTLEYEYEAAVEPHYRGSLVKAFKKTVSDGFFSFIIVDSVNEKTKDYEEMWSFAKQKGFQVYIAEMDNDVTVCTGRNIHKRTEKEISDLAKVWETTPTHYLRLDVRSLLQSDAITEVEMEVVSDTELEKTIGKNSDEEKDEEEGDEEDEFHKEDEKKDDEEEDEPGVSAFVKSRWDQFENSEKNLDRLDGLKRRREGFHATMEDYLQLPDDFDQDVKESTPGKKRVRWADLEERKQQEKMRAIGFVVGQTDWSRMTDPTFGESALTKTKYI